MGLFDFLKKKKRNDKLTESSLEVAPATGTSLSVRGLTIPQYLQQLSDHKFAFSPPGNGVDCHRIWECFYLGVIPIVKRSPHTENYKDLPVLIIDDWNQH